MHKFTLILALLILISLTAFSKSEIKGKKMEIILKSSDFKEGELIPKKFTCDGANISPQLTWSGVPENAKSIAIICDDLDAPSGDWVHWVVYNIPVNINSLPGGVPTQPTLQNGANHGKNDFGKFGYGGPCPPGGTHRYYFKIYALDRLLNIPAGATKADLLKAMNGHIVAQGQLMGKYGR